MIPQSLRLLLALLCGLGGAVAFFFDYWLSLALWLSALLLMAMHFKYGSIVGVLRALGKGDVDGAERLLNAIKRPDWLAKSYQAYYHFSYGLIAYRRGEVEPGKERFLKALELGLPGRYERAIACLNLAHAYYRDQDQTSAREYLEKAKANQADDLFLKKRVEELEQALNQA